MKKYALISCMAAVALAGCGKSAVPAPEASPARPIAQVDRRLPADRQQAAATCYAARIVRLPDGPLPPEGANEAGHFLYLGAVNDGIASPTTLQKLVKAGNVIRANMSKDDAPRYAGACAKTFPQSQAIAFKELPADSRGTRMMCFTLSTAVLQMYRSSEISAPAATVELNDRLDAGLLAEINAEGEPNIAELSGFAMRSMAKAVELGPVNEVLRACTARYNDRPSLRVGAASPHASSSTSQ